MDTLHCAEYLSESPSTSTTSSNVVSASNGQRRRRSLASKCANNVNYRPNQTQIVHQPRLILGQLPLCRKRPATCDRLNAAQWPSVLSLPDKTVHQDSRCIENMLNTQMFTAVNSKYFLTVQTKITSKHRQQAVEWLLDVCNEEKCESDVFPLAVSYIDRFLSVQNIDRDKLQALVSVCLFIASKVKAPQPLNAKRIAYYTDGAVLSHEILKWELLVLGELNWDVSTATAFDFLDQIAARYSAVHELGAVCRAAVHRIQLEEKLAFMLPSVQAAVCLLYAAMNSASTSAIYSAQHAVLTLLNCEPKLIYEYMGLVDRAVNSIPCHNATDNEEATGLLLVAPPSSGEYCSPATSPRCASELTVPALQSSLYRTPEQASDDSGFNSGYSSPATAVLEAKMNGVFNDVSLNRRLARRSAPGRMNTRLFEHVDGGILVSYHPTEQDFLNF